MQQIKLTLTEILISRDHIIKYNAKLYYYTSFRDTDILTIV